jgi:arylsulfatase A-like enzyme
MRKIVVVLASVGLAVGLLFFVSYIGPTDNMNKAQALSAKPNIVFILTDDMRKGDLKYMPKTRNLLQQKGTSFQNAFVSDGLCCPSRATIMRGQYAHNTGVWSNREPDGGWQEYSEKGNEQDNVATRLKAAGYRTALIGKYLNNYESAHVPRGWDRWFATWGEYYGYYANDQGTVRHYGTKASAYRTDVESSKTRTFIGNSVAQGKPFFAYVAPKAPHEAKSSGEAVPAPCDRHVYDGLKAPRPPSYNERNISDKPPWIRQLSRLSADTKAKIDKRHEKRAESLQAVDDLVAGVIGKLRDKGVLSNTYVFFTSDNGFHHGEHRIRQGKARPYEEDTHAAPCARPRCRRGPPSLQDGPQHRLHANLHRPRLPHIEPV